MKPAARSISLNTRTPFHQNKRIHLRATIMGSPWLWFTDLLCLNSKAKGSFKQRYLCGADAVSGAELVPDLSVIGHG